MMKKIETTLSGVYIIENNIFSDIRGSFSKRYNKAILKEIGISFNIEELFYTVSHKNVIRGMHFQVPPMEHDKLVFVTHGKVLDVILDLRMKSPTYGKSISVELSAERQNSVLVPVGCAHGYKVIEENSITIYLATSGFSPECDMAIRWDSFGFDWGLESPIISEKDRLAVDLEDFKTPFRDSF